MNTASPTAGSSARQRREFLVVWSVGLLVALAVLYCYEPKGQFFYPRCPFYSVTGWQCPGCGGLRATHQMLHGHLAAALALNPLAVVLWPIAAFLGIGHLMPGKPGAALLKHRLAGWSMVSLLVVFGILRNLW